MSINRIRINRRFVATFLVLYGLIGLVSILAQSNEGGNIEGSNEVVAPASSSYYQDPTEVTRESSESFTLVWVRLFLVMGVFVGVCLLLIRYLKKKNNLESVDNELFEVISEFAISINKKIKIMRIVNDYYVLAVSQDQVNLIKQIEDKESLDKLQLEAGRVSESKYSFAEFLSSYVSGGKGKGSGAGSAFSVTENLKKRLGKDG